MTKQFWTIDAETDPFLYERVPEPFIWGAYNGFTMEYKTFNTTQELIDFMKPRKEIFYAHNGGKFDFHLGEIPDNLNTHEKILMIGARLVKAKIGLAEIRDSYALLPFPLKDMGNKLEIEYWKLEKEHRQEHMAEIKEYLQADCVELWEVLNAFFDEHGRHLTCASAAIKSLMKIENLKIPNSGQAFFEDISPHYFGGRCQLFKQGSYIDDKLNYFDINSAYPWAMVHEHPIGNEYDIEYKENPKIIGNRFYKIKAISKGALPVREKSGLTFPNDNKIKIFYTTGWELLAGIETNTIIIKEHIHQKVFRETKSFEKYIYHFWDKRKQHEKGSYLNLFCKLMMNSAYGKFAANPDNYDTYIIYNNRISEYLINNGWDLKGDIGKENILASKPLEENDMRYYNVATGASITGFVRAMLIRVINNVTEPIYCDTDSIIFRGKHNINIGSELGQWDIEGIYNEGHFAGKKLYGVKNQKEIKIASKGSRLDFEEIKEIAQGKELEYNFDAPTFSWKKETCFLSRTIRKT